MQILMQTPKPQRIVQMTLQLAVVFATKPDSLLVVLIIITNTLLTSTLWLGLQLTSSSRVLRCAIELWLAPAALANCTALALLFGHFILCTHIGYDRIGLDRLFGVHFVQFPLATLCTPC